MRPLASSGWPVHGFALYFFRYGTMWTAHTKTFIYKYNELKGTVSRDGFGFWWYARSVLGLNRGHGRIFQFFRCSNDFITQTEYFSLLTRVFVGLIMLAASRVSLLLIGQQGLEHFFSYRPLLPIGWRIVHILRQRRRKTTNTAPTTLSAISSSKQIYFCQLTIILHYSDKREWQNQIHLVGQSL